MSITYRDGMADINLLTEQKPVKKEYRTTPQVANIALTATGAEEDERV